MHKFNTKKVGKFRQANVCFAQNSVGVEKSNCIKKRCTKQPALTAERNVKFRSSQTQAGQCIAESVTLNEGLHEDIKLTS
jgi:hypothetical protein